MDQIDKKDFGDFIARKRKEKNMTQKDISDKLFVSVQAVSKWERGLSFPDISLLIPLSRILNVKVSDLLRAEEDTEEANDKVEDLIQKVLIMEGKDPEEKRKERTKKITIFLISLGLIAIEYYVFYKYLDLGPENFLTEIILGLAFSISSWLFLDEVLPSYYDENKISFVSNGFFRINLVGVYFNNNNWKAILSYLRYWSLASMFFAPFFKLLIGSDLRGGMVSLVIFLMSIFLPVYILAKKYE
ncbi:helix-turn-helix domain-containing protein [Peptoniphilus catoniae]|uniref:helix-turn-helix domain-containing protein n=1 Tax=Peptoniphilus catoniae TaxID=1660341 RepID=UPI0010FE7CB2|nr:helix-turn-helix domain-containing protein [Peptoniphilus catoniae]